MDIRSVSSVLFKKFDGRVNYILSILEPKLEERAKAQKFADKLKSALEFKKRFVAVEDIAKALGLTFEQVEELK